MQTQSLTAHAVAESMLTHNRPEILAFMDAKAAMLCRASYSRGDYGRLWVGQIKKAFPGLNLNGASTRIGLAVERLLGDEGYAYITERVDGINVTRFARK